MSCSSGGLETPAASKTRHTPDFMEYNLAISGSVPRMGTSIMEKMNEEKLQKSFTTIGFFPFPTEKVSERNRKYSSSNQNTDERTDK